MAAKKQQEHLVYWDSCVFLSWVNGTPDRLPIIEALFNDVTVRLQGKIVTSTVSIVEVAKAQIEQEQQQEDKQVEQRIKAMWQDPNIRFVEAARPIMEAARDLMRWGINDGYALKPMDAIHLSTAKYIEKNGLLIHEFHTYDDPLMKYQALLGFTICVPHCQPPPRQTSFADHEEDWDETK